MFLSKPPVSRSKVGKIIKQKHTKASMIKINLHVHLPQRGPKNERRDKANRPRSNNHARMEIYNGCLHINFSILCDKYYDLGNNDQNQQDRIN